MKGVGRDLLPLTAIQTPEVEPGAESVAGWAISMAPGLVT
jgi:hypothetical protein